MYTAKQYLRTKSVIIIGTDDVFEVYCLIHENRVLAIFRNQCYGRYDRYFGNKYRILSMKRFTTFVIYIHRSELPTWAFKCITIWPFWAVFRSFFRPKTLSEVELLGRRHIGNYPETHAVQSVKIPADICFRKRYNNTWAGMVFDFLLLITWKQYIKVLTYANLDEIPNLDCSEIVFESRQSWLQNAHITDMFIWGLADLFSQYVKAVGQMTDQYSIIIFLCGYFTQ
jgi:hypothetical protein